MADNVEADAGSGGATFATDEIAGTPNVHYPISKLCWGALNTINIADAASGKAIPVQGEAAENAATTGNPVLVGGRYDSTPRTLGDGDVGAAALDADGAVQVSDGGNSLTVDNGGTFAVQVDGDALTSLQALDDAVDGNYLNTNMNIAGTDVSAGAGVLTAQTQRVTIATDDEVNNLLGTIDADTSTIAAAVDTEMQCDIVGSLPAGDNNIGNVDIASSVALDVSAATVTVDLGANNDVQGAAAHGAAVSGNPLLTGLEGRTTDGTAVDSGDNVRALADTLGKQVVLQGSVHDLHWSFETNITDTADDEAKAAAAGVKHVVTAVLVTNAHATTATKVEIKDGSTVKLTGYAAEGGGGFSLNNGGAPLFIGTANTAVNVANVTDSSNTEIFICGYSIAN